MSADYLPDAEVVELCQDLIKIDTEGSEESILHGARQTLGTCRPWVIFESWRGPGREALLAFFADLEYSICALPLELPRSPQVLDRTSLLAYADTNLIALPIEDVR